jgi:hypothetical protein
MGKSLRWSGNLWCMNPLHYECPKRITREMFILKHCRRAREGGGRCPWLFIDRKGTMEKRGRLR